MCRSTKALGISPVVAIGAVLLCLGGKPAAAAGIEVSAGAVGGSSSCFTWGLPASWSLYNAGLGVGNVGNGISDCGMSGSLVDLSAAAGPLTAVYSLSTPSGGGTFTGSATGTASYGVAGAAADGSMSGITDALVFSEAAAFGQWEDVLTFTSPTHPNGTIGSINYSFTVHGSMSITSPHAPYNAQVYSTLAMRQGAYYNSTVFNASVNTGQVGTILGDHTYPGFLIGLESISGTGDFVAGGISFVWGTPFTLKVGLELGAYPVTDSAVAGDFSTTATLTGIQAFDGGNPVSDFTILSQSGAGYGAAGILSQPAGAPEPATITGVGGALLLGLAVATRRSRSARRNR